MIERGGALVVPGDFRRRGLRRSPAGRRALIWSALSDQPALGGAPEYRQVVRPFQRITEALFAPPGVIVCRGFGLQSLFAGLYRSIARRSRFYIYAAEPPAKAGLRHRLSLRLADGVLADGAATAHAFSRAPLRAREVRQLPIAQALQPYLQCAPARPAADARRIVFAGGMSPQSGVADLLSCAAAWSEQNPAECLELCWIGEGDLLGVLAAQPLPVNIIQLFLGDLGAEQTAQTFGQCGIMAAPALVDDGLAPVIAGLAAGLPVLGSVRSRAVRQFVTEGLNGWLFDPLEPGDMVRALARALATPAGQLDAMRRVARDSVRPGDAGILPPALHPSPAPVPHAVLEQAS